MLHEALGVEVMPCLAMLGSGYHASSCLIGLIKGLKTFKNQEYWRPAIYIDFGNMGQ